MEFDPLNGPQTSYPVPVREDKSLTIDGTTFRPNQVVRTRATNRLGQEVYRTSYVLDVDRAEETVTFFSLRDEARITHTADELRPALGDPLHVTDDVWDEDR